MVGLAYPSSMSNQIAQWREAGYPIPTIQGYVDYLQKQKMSQNKGTYGKDSEKTKTYKCEWAFQREYQVKEFDTIRQAQKRADQITKSALWAKLREEKGRSRMLSLNVNSKMRNTGKNMAGWARGNTITLDLICGLDEYTLIHEMTHCLGNWHHGRSFRRDLLKLVSRFMGTDAAKILKSKFKEKKLACGEQRKPLSFEKWIEARDRMSKMRNSQ